MTFVVLHATRSPVTQLRIGCFQCGASRSLMKINALNLRQQAKERNFALRVWAYPRGCPSPASRANETRQVSHHNTSERWHRLLTVTWQLFLTLYHCEEKRGKYATLFQTGQCSWFYSRDPFSAVFIFCLSSRVKAKTYILLMSSTISPARIWPRVILMPFFGFLNALFCLPLQVCLSCPGELFCVRLETRSEKCTSRGHS